MALNEEKCHFMIFGNKSKDSVVAIGKSTIKESECEKLLGVTFDKKLSFKKHVQDLCKEAQQKLHVLARFSNYIDPIKSKRLIDLQSLSHRPLVADFSIFYRYFQGHCSQEIKNIIPDPVRRVRTTRSSTHSHPFQVALPYPRTLAHISSFIPRTSQLWNSLPPTTFSESYNLSSFKSNVNKLDLVSFST